MSSPPPDYGSRLMPHVVDEIASQTPNLAYASVPLGATTTAGFKDVTFSEMASAINYLAAWIERTLGKSEKFDSLAYLGVTDLRYVVVFLAAMKCGWQLVLPSPRNPAKMNVSLLEQTCCSQLLYGPEVESLIAPIVAEHSSTLHVHPIQPIESLIHPDTPHYPFNKTYQQAKWDPILVLYSSGSTGPPKPIIFKHAAFAVADSDRNLPTVPGRVNQNISLWNFSEKSHFYTPFPLFHMAGIFSYTMVPIFYPTATPVLGPTSAPPTGALVNDILDQFPRLKALFSPPIMIEQLLQIPGTVAKCERLKFVLYAGAMLSQSAGDALTKVTDVCQFYGQTETGPIQGLVARREDWASLEWHPATEVVMERFDGIDKDSGLSGEPEIYEMTMHRNPALESVRALSCNYPEVPVWHTKDLFTKHPTKPGLWRFYGRTDDFVVLSNAGKFNPVSVEMAVSGVPGGERRVGGWEWEEQGCVDS